MNRNINNKTLEERKKELNILRTEWEKMKEQEKELKKQFYESPKNSSERAKIKNKLTPLQREIFDKGHCGRCQKDEIKKDELFEKAKNTTEPITNPAHLASLIKAELKATLNGSRKTRKGDRVGDYWEIAQGKYFWTFTDNKEIRKGIENLSRVRNKKLERDNMTIRGTEVKRGDLSPADYDEIMSLIRQVRDYLEKKDKQDRQKTENIKLNNPHLFTQSCCSTEKRNGVRKWENWHTFSGKRNGFNYTIYVPDNHFALTNVLFDDGWGTNSEVNKFFVVKGATEPTELHYWNVEKQRDEIISEDQAQKLIKQGKEWYINYKTYVELSDEITIDHYQENGQELAKPVSGVNQEVENSNQQNASGGLITNGTENNQSPEINTEFFLKYFQEHDIKKISLTPERELLIEYNDGRTEISGKYNKPELQKLINYYQENGETSLSQQDLANNLNKTNNLVENPNSNKKLWIGLGLGAGGALIIGVVVWLLTKDKTRAETKEKVKNNN